MTDGDKSHTAVVNNPLGYFPGPISFFASAQAPSVSLFAVLAAAGVMGALGAGGGEFPTIPYAACRVNSRDQLHGHDPPSVFLTTEVNMTGLGIPFGSKTLAPAMLAVVFAVSACAGAPPQA
jgi:hypothetical protein